MVLDTNIALLDGYSLEEYEKFINAISYKDAYEWNLAVLEMNRNVVRYMLVYHRITNKMKLYQDKATISFSPASNYSLTLRVSQKLHVGMYSLGELYINEEAFIVNGMPDVYYGCKPIQIDSHTCIARPCDGKKLQIEYNNIPEHLHGMVSEIFNASTEEYFSSDFRFNLELEYGNSSLAKMSSALKLPMIHRNEMFFFCNMIPKCVLMIADMTIKSRDELILTPEFAASAFAKNAINKIDIDGSVRTVLEMYNRITGA